MNDVGLTHMTTVESPWYSEL